MTNEDLTVLAEHSTFLASLIAGITAMYHGADNEDAHEIRKAIREKGEEAWHYLLDHHNMKSDPPSTPQDLAEQMIRSLS